MWAAQLYNLLLKPLDLLPAWWGLGLISVGTGLLLPLLYRWTSDQEGLRRTKQKLQAHLLEIVLYRHDLRALGRAEKKLLASNLAYLRQALRPLAVAFLLLGPLFGPLNLRYGYRPLPAGKTTLVSVKLRPEGGNLPEVTLETPPGVEVEAVVRIPCLQEISWRVRGQAQGRYVLSVVAGRQRLAKELIVGESSQRLSPKRVRSGFWDQLFHSTESPLPPEAGVETIAIRYPPTALAVGPWRVHWVVPFLLISLLVSFGVKGRLGIQV